MGEIKRPEEQERERRLRDRFLSTVAIAAAIIVAMRLARDEDFGRSSPKLMFTINESIRVAREIARKAAQG